MKVFNWVHRRFLNVNSCTAFLQEEGSEKGASTKIENDKHVLLGHDGHNMVVDMLDNWNDGILSIGTIAISPLEACKYGILEEEDDDVRELEMANIVIENDVEFDNYDIECDNEASPLMNVEFFSHELEKVIGANHEITEEEVVEDVVDLKDDTDCYVNNENEGQTKRRVTLADLFLEDNDYHHPIKVLKEVEGDNVDGALAKDDSSNGKLSFEVTLKPTSRAKNGISKAKKLIKEDLHPLKKFNKLMKRMMKKKIHPDMEGKTQKDMHMNPSYGLRDPTNHQDNAANNELASLLLIQDVMV